MVCPIGVIIIQEFIHINDLKLICRAHQLVQEGYKYIFDDTLITVWSAPNYNYRCWNIAAILEINSVSSKKKTKLFNAVPNNERKTPPRSMSPYFL